MDLTTDDIYCGILVQPECLNKARVLLYESYIQHLAWEITHDNPSNIKIHHRDEYTLLTDDYDELSIWFSISRGTEVIACARLCYEDEQGKLEIERYSNARESIADILQTKQRLNILELNREAILPAYSDKKDYYALLLLKTIFSYCIDNNHTILTTSNIRDWVEVYERISFEYLRNYTFKYFDSEPLPVLVYLATPDDLKQLINNIDLLMDTIDISLESLKNFNQNSSYQSSFHTDEQ